MSIFEAFILALIISMLFTPGYRRCPLNNIFFRSVHGRYGLAVLDNSIWYYVVQNTMEAASVHLDLLIFGDNQTGADTGFAFSRCWSFLQKRIEVELFEKLQQWQNKRIDLLRAFNQE